MRADHGRRMVAALITGLSATAMAETGLDIAGDVTREEYTFPAGAATVEWQRVTLTPWWEDGPWRVTADIPWLAREASASGMVLVWRRIGGVWTQVPLVVNYGQEDSGIGDVRVAATHAWRPNDWLTPYVTGELKLPTGEVETSGTATFTTGTQSGSRRTASGFTFGDGSTEFRLAPGVTVANALGWATAEPAYIWSNDDEVPTEDRPAAYAGIGFTPMKWLEMSVEFEYEGAITDGGDDLEQWTYSVTVLPTRKLAISVSTYTNESAITPDDNVTIGVSARL